MPAQASPPNVSRSRRPFLGLRRTPGRLAIIIFRVPLHLYRRGWGWLLGRTFLVLVHVGRNTGHRRETVAMVLADDPNTEELAICSAWGPDADWLRNLQTGPPREVQVGRDRFVPLHRFLTDAEAFSVGVAFREAHPWRLRLLSAILGWGDLRSDEAVRAFVKNHPFVGLRPTHRVAG